MNRYFTTRKKKTSKSKKLSPKQKQIAEIMHQFEGDDLHYSKTETIVANPEQAIAIALCEREELEKKI